MTTALMGAKDHENTQPPAQQVVVSIPDLTVFWENCREYILGPIVSNIVDKKVKDMSVGDLSKALESKIANVMADFIKVGTKAKELSQKDGDKDTIAAYHYSMAQLFHMVRPAEATVRGMYPKMVKLFDQLNKLYPDQYTQLDYEIDEKQFMATEKEVAKAFSDKQDVKQEPAEDNDEQEAIAKEKDNSNQVKSSLKNWIW